MKIFISWSGEISRKVAVVLRQWLPNVIQSIDPYISLEISKGDRWSSEIFKNLDSTHFGIICVTKENIKSPWLNFEAGALSKSFENGATKRVCPFLFGVDIGALQASPLSQFQVTRYEKEDIRKLIQSINTARDNPILTENLNNSFEKWWVDLKDKLDPIFKQTRKRVVWAFETTELNADHEISMIEDIGNEIMEKWYLGHNEPPKAEEAQIMVYVFGKSEESKSRLTEFVDFLNTLPNKIPLIVYTRYAMGNKNLDDEELKIIQQYENYVLSNMPSTLKKNVESMLKDV